MKDTFPHLEVDVYAMRGQAQSAHASPVVYDIREDDLEDYGLAAGRINASGARLLWIQHEFGIYGGPAGDYLLHLLDHVEVPVIATLHTVLETPDDHQRRVMKAMLSRLSAVVVMAERGRQLLVGVYGVDQDLVRVIPHGVPDRPLVPPEQFKRKFGWSGRDVILSFGLLAPNKGLEAMIAALPAVAEGAPRVLYVVLGATHPNLVASEGEAYRRGLEASARALGVERHIIFIDRYVEDELLIDYLQAADLYVTPYTNPAQITSGTLAYAVGVGKVVVSTPYAHAREILANGAGILVEFGDTKGFGEAIIDILRDQPRSRAISLRAYARGRTMTWPRLASAAMSAMVEVVGRPDATATDRSEARAEERGLREVQFRWREDCAGHSASAEG